MDEGRRRHRLLEGIRERRQRHLERNRFLRIGFAFFGFIVVLAGVAMLVLPGPALAVIPLGLAILALEFTWAEELLERSLEQANKAKNAAAQTSRTQRILTGVAIALGVAAFIVWAVIGDIPVLPV